jgi:hypothetical protein
VIRVLVPSARSGRHLEHAARSPVLRLKLHGQTGP